MDRVKVNLPPESKLRTERDSAHRITTNGFAEAAAELRAFLADFSPQEDVDEFITVIERLPLSPEPRQVGEPDTRVVALAGVEGAMADYQIALTVAESRCASHRDFLRQFRDLKKWPTKQRLQNILERDKDENNLRPAKSAIRFALLRLGDFGVDIPSDWVERLGDSPNLLRKVAEAVCKHFAYKLDRHGRPRDIPLEEYANRLAQIYEVLTGGAITYAKATDTSKEREAGEPYGAGLDFLLAGLRLIDQTGTPYQAAAHIERIRNAGRG